MLLKGPMAKTKKPKLTEAQILIGTHFKELGIGFEYEKQFLHNRLFRFDLFFEHRKDYRSEWVPYGVELDGGMWSGGHRHKKAIELDYEKSNLAQVNGFRILRFTNEQVESGYAKSFIKEWVIGK